jgi:hypothetical protein
MAAPSLECRLLAASGCAYAIHGGGNFTPRARCYDAVGFTAAPTPLGGGNNDIYVCLGGTNAEGVIRRLSRHAASRTHYQARELDGA